MRDDEASAHRGVRAARQLSARVHKGGEVCDPLASHAAHQRRLRAWRAQGELRSRGAVRAALLGWWLHHDASERARGRDRVRDRRGQGRTSGRQT